MEWSPTYPAAMLNEHSLDMRNPARRLVDWLVDARSHRVLCMLAGLWLINLFDLVLTILAHSQGMLSESNPIARSLLPLGPQVLAAFKFVLVGGASAVLIINRRKLISELSSALMLLIYAGVAVRWKLCYELYNISTSANVTNEELDHLNSWAGNLPII